MPHSVLITEDDADTREALIELARQVGLDAVGVASGVEALAVLQRGLRPCLILLDLVMSDLDGFAFRRAQLADPTIADIPIVVVSGGGLEVERGARQLGLNRFLRKPLVLEELARLFTDHCHATGAEWMRREA